MSAAVEKIVESVKALSPDEFEELWIALEQIPPEPINRPSPELIDSIMGKYAHIPTSSDEFNMRKQEEIELENRRFPR